MDHILEWEFVHLDTWLARTDAHRYQIRHTGTAQHGPWRLQVYTASNSQPVHEGHLPDREAAERIANDHASDHDAIANGDLTLCPACRKKHPLHTAHRRVGQA